MTSVTACGIFNRLGNNEEDTADNEISPKNTLSAYRHNNKGEPAAERPAERTTRTSGSKTHPHPEVPPSLIREELAGHQQASQAGISVTFEPKKTWVGYVVQQVLERPHQIRKYPLVPGAVLFEVDDRSVADKSPEELTALLSGPKGSTVWLGLKTDGKKRT
jgi:hypothetical protein